MKNLFKKFHVLLFLYISLSAPLYAEIINVYPGQENTLYNISQNVQAGDIVIFHDGTYIERKRVQITKVGGTEEKPIVFKSANPHGAKILFDMERGTWGRVFVTVPYIHFEDFELTQTTIPEPTTEDPNPTWNHILTFYTGANHCKVSGNMIHNGYEEAIKAYNVCGMVAENNYIFNFIHEGIDFDKTDDSFIRYNHLYNIGRTHIMLKYDNATDTLVFGNYIHNDKVQMNGGGFGITLGGYSSAGVATQATNCIAFNNIIVSETPGLIIKGLAIISAINCGFYNNIVIGTDYGMWTNQSSSQQVINPTFKNNIFYNIQFSASYFKGIGSGLNTDYNLYYNTPNPPSETHGVYNIDPDFVDPVNNDWRMKLGSPAIDSGVQWAFNTIEGREINVAHDYKRGIRSGKWDIGAYEYQPLELILIASPLNFHILSK